MADLPHNGELKYTTDDIGLAATAVITGNVGLVEQGLLSQAEADGARTGIFALMLVLGITIEFEDGGQLKPWNVAPKPPMRPDLN